MLAHLRIRQSHSREIMRVFQCLMHLVQCEARRFILLCLWTVWRPLGHVWPYFRTIRIGHTAPNTAEIIISANWLCCVYYCTNAAYHAVGEYCMNYSRTCAADRTLGYGPRSLRLRSKQHTLRNIESINDWLFRRVCCSLHYAPLCCYPNEPINVPWRWIIECTIYVVIFRSRIAIESIRYARTAARAHMFCVSAKLRSTATYVWPEYVVAKNRLCCSHMKPFEMNKQNPAGWMHRLGGVQLAALFRSDFGAARCGNIACTMLH